MIVLTSNDLSKKPESNLGFTNYLILNKQKNEWQKLELPGNKTRIRGFQSWLAALVLSDKREQKSPGFASLRNKITKTGMPFEWQIDGIYSPGILILYNPIQNQKITIETNQGDSEILFVENKQVYYRVNDEIYQAKIGTDKIADSKLLVKSDIVPDIHWAFLGP